MHSTPHNTIEHTHAKISLRTLERQVSQGDPNDEVVGHWYSLAYASK